jgi:hypothetical protein
VQIDAAVERVRAQIAADEPLLRRLEAAMAGADVGLPPLKDWPNTKLCQMLKLLPKLEDTEVRVRDLAVVVLINDHQLRLPVDKAECVHALIHQPSLSFKLAASVQVAQAVATCDFYLESEVESILRLMGLDDRIPLQCVHGPALVAPLQVVAMYDGR